MLVYLKGISKDELENISNFIYNGETFLPQQDLESFLETAKELKVKGVQKIEFDVPESNTNTIDSESASKRKIIPIEEPDDTNIANEEFCRSQPSYNRKLNIIPVDEPDDIEQNERDSSRNQEQLESSTINDTDLVNGEIDEGEKNTDVEDQLDKMVFKSMGLWKCKSCDKSFKKRSGSKKHAEIHLKGLVYACAFCSKTFPTRHGLASHVYDYHTKLYSCDICGKTDINKRNTYFHKNGCIGTLKEQ